MSEDPHDEVLPWREIVAQAAHDMKTPLSCMRTALEVLRMLSTGSVEQDKFIGILDTQVDELSGQLETLLRTPAAFMKSKPNP